MGLTGKKSGAEAVGKEHAKNKFFKTGSKVCGLLLQQSELWSMARWVVRSKRDPGSLRV